MSLDSKSLHVEGRPAGRYAGAALLFLALLSALVLFGLLAEDVAEREAISFDLPLLFWLRGVSSPALDAAMRAVTELGSAWAVVPLLLAAVWVQRRRRWAAIYLLAANAGAALLNVAAKHAFERIRPAYWTPLVHETTFSFPSGHAMQTMALVTSLVLARRRREHLLWLSAAGAAYVIAVGVSRSYLGVHYPSDVLAGWCAAFCWCHGLALAMPRSRRSGT